MCGITGIVNFKGVVGASDLQRANSIVRHRGPDDEGYMLWGGELSPIVYSGEETSEGSIAQHSLLPLPMSCDWMVAFGHRRLAIQDLSAAGHQPMMDPSTGVCICFNGEVYNYKEIREELELLGSRFISHSDTEVILKAWIQWGKAALSKFNGMFSILLLDPRSGGKLIAIRDRFGVKPLYWTVTENYIAFASEIKQLKVLPDYSFRLNNSVAFDYLSQGLLDHSRETFTEGISQLGGGELMEVSLVDNQYRIESWYSLPVRKFKGTDEDAIQEYHELLLDAIRFRLRADVTVGSCLSGGLDSSSIVSLMAKLLKESDNSGIKTITACYQDSRYDEWKFAESVVKASNAQGVQIFPSFQELCQELDLILWHMDEPFGSTSQFSQWSVFKGAHGEGLKVMLDGQGADEQLAGYGGNDIPLYAGLLKERNFLELRSEILAAKEANGVLPKGFLIQAAIRVFPYLKRILPRELVSQRRDSYPNWLKPYHGEFSHSLAIPRSLRQSLEQQTLRSSLPALLRYEDRNSMAFSIESRVPFMDYRLVEFTFSLPERLIYKRGLRKYVLRKAMLDVIPKLVSDRRDKMGFVTPEEMWFKGEGRQWFEENLYESIEVLKEFVDEERMKSTIALFFDNKVPFDFSFWRVICLGRWLRSAKGVS